ncbi:hypothetical protein [Acetobacter indonesiensis]|nr:hypothetical protein [Acetobacter indonesiensis]
MSVPHKDKGSIGAQKPLRTTGQPRPHDRRELHHALRLAFAPQGTHQ